MTSIEALTARVADYAQRLAKADAEAMVENQQAQEYMRAISEIAKADFDVCEVIDSFENS